MPSILCLVLWFMSVQNPFDLYQKLVVCLVDKFLKENKYEITELKNEKTDDGSYEKSTMHFVVDILKTNEEKTQKL